MAVSKVVKSNGDVIMDISQDNVNPNNLLQGGTAHGSDGEAVQGAVIVAPTDVTEVSDTTPYIYKTSEHDAVYDELVGGSVAWNQLVANSGSSLSVTITSGHKYVMKKNGTLSVGASGGSAITGLTGGTDWITDLTLMFGSTIADYAYNLEQSTAGSGIAWLKSYGFFTKDYYAYNAGGMVSVNTSGKKVVGKNLLEITAESTTINGVTFTVDKATGTITANGTASANTSLLLSPYPKGNGNVIISATNNASCFYTLSVLNGGNAFVGRFIQIVNDVEVNYDNESRDIGLFLGIDSGTTISNLVLKPMIRRADVTDSTFEPYTSLTYPIQSTDLRGLYKLSGNKLYTDGDIYSADGTVTRKYGYRDYQSGDESLANAITDGTHTIYKLSAPTTAPAPPFTSPQMVYRNGTEEYLDTRDVPLPVGGNRKYIDIPDWMVNEYFDDVRAEASTISEVKKELHDFEEHLEAFIIKSSFTNPSTITNTSDFTDELFDKYWGSNTDLYPRFAHLYLSGNTRVFLKAIISSVISNNSIKMIKATFLYSTRMYDFTWIYRQVPSMSEYTIQVVSPT